jgi:3-dehydroquinate dehydratase / shikimate dehydrogenase
MLKATLVATLLDEPSSREEDLAALPNTVEWLEVRADLIGDFDVDWLRRHFRGGLIYSLRSHAEGGRAASDPSDRTSRLLAAANQYDLINLEGDRDLCPELLARIPCERRMISWHGPTIGVEPLKSKFAKFAEVAARYYKLAPAAARSGDEIAPLSLLRFLSRSDTAAYATGPIGVWSRLASLGLGSPLVFGAVGSPAEEPSINRMIADYGLPNMMPFREIYGIAGNPVSHSLSPRLHNAGYRTLGREALFVPFHVESFSDFWDHMLTGSALHSLGMPIMGLTVASPHKEAALAAATKVSSIASGAGSANLLVRDNGYWRADTTDPDIVFVSSRERGVEVKQRRAAVIGCGGAGRAIAAALDQSGAQVTLVNRGKERGSFAAQLLGLPYVPLLNFDAEGYHVIVNATPVGRDDDAAPFKLETLADKAVVIDLVYGSRPTPLVSNSIGLGRTVIDGRDVLLTQVRRQFQIMTGREMSAGLARETLGQQVAKAAGRNGKIRDARIA